MKLAYADPPYPGQSERHYSEHADYAGEVDHEALVDALERDFDGYVLHTSSTALFDVLSLFVERPRVMAWCKSFAAFKRNVPVAYAWEPVLVRAARKPVVAHRLVMRDWIVVPITMKRGLSGAKPDAVCRWLFEVMGAQPDDELVDLYPGTSAVTRAWDAWRSQISIFDEVIA